MKSHLILMNNHSQKVTTCFPMLCFSVFSLISDESGDVPHYIVRNSWGEDFGDRGFLYIRFGGNVCGEYCLSFFACLPFFFVYVSVYVHYTLCLIVIFIRHLHFSSMSTHSTNQFMFLYTRK